MDIVTLAVIIVAAFLGGLTWLVAERIPLPGWACFMAAALITLLIYSLGPRVLGG